MTTVNAEPDIELRYRTLITFLTQELANLAERARKGHPSDHTDDCCHACCPGHVNQDYLDGIEDLQQLVGDIEPSTRTDKWIDYDKDFPDVADGYTASYRAGQQLDELGIPALPTHQ